MAGNNMVYLRDNASIGNVSTLEDFFDLTQTHGSIYKAVSNTLYGLNIDAITPIISKSRDSNGYVFFTRPQLNLGDFNLRTGRKTVDYLTKNKNSILRYVRCLLDPRLMKDSNYKLECDLLDPDMAFIPVFSNTIKTLSGWPDPVTPTWTSPEGLRREQWTYVDGTNEIFNSFSLTATFNNIKNEPITRIIDLWTNYMTGVFDGTMSPYVDFIGENEIDYNTRIYRIVLDETRTFVKKIAATGAAFPNVNPLGKFFDYTNESAYNNQTSEISINFECNGACYNDPILIKEFNETVVIFNQEMKPLLQGGLGNMERIPTSMLSLFNYRAYPWIKPDTSEFCWFVNKKSKSYAKVISYLQSIG